MWGVVTDWRHSRDDSRADPSRAPLGSTWRGITGDGDANRRGSVSLCVAKSAGGKISPLVVEKLVLQD